MVDSDFDLISDYDEVKIYYSNPRYPSFILKVSDYLLITNHRYLASGLEYEEFISRNSAAIVSEYALNAILCGGEADIQKRNREELLNVFTEYVEKNEEGFKASSALNVINTYLRGVNDFTSTCGELYKDSLKRTVNETQSELICLIKNGAANQATIKWYSEEIEALKKTFNKADKYIDNIAKAGNVAGFVISMASANVKTYEEFMEYLPTLEIVKNFEDILYILSYCGDENIEEAARQISLDLEADFEKYDVVINKVAERYGFSFSYNGIIALFNLGIAMTESTTMLEYELSCFVTSAIVGSSLNARIDNAITVECTNAIAMAFSTVINNWGAAFRTDADGNAIIIIEGEIASWQARQLYPLCLFARLRQEEKFRDDTFHDDLWLSYGSRLELIESCSCPKEEYDNMSPYGYLDLLFPNCFY